MSAVHMGWLMFNDSTILDSRPGLECFAAQHFRANEAVSYQYGTTIYKNLDQNFSVSVVADGISAVGEQHFWTSAVEPHPNSNAPMTVCVMYGLSQHRFMPCDLSTTRTHYLKNFGAHLTINRGTGKYLHVKRNSASKRWHRETWRLFSLKESGPLC